MARGRTFFLDQRRRAASVPAGDLSYPSLSTASQVYNIASHVARDTDDLLSASKRRDHDFLHDIQTKLVNPSLFKSSYRPPVTNHHKHPIVTNTFSRAPVHHHDSRRRTWVGPTSSAIDHNEVDDYLAKPIHRPWPRSIRAGSVPPVLPSTTATASRWYPSYSARGASVPQWGSSAVYRPLANQPGYGRNYLTNHPQMEDLVVGVAPTTYGDIVIGIPYRKAFMFNAQHELDTVEPRNPYGHLPTRVTSPYYVASTNFANRHTPLLNTTYDDVDVIPRRRYTFSGPVHTTRSSGNRWLPGGGYHGYDADAGSGSKISTYSNYARLPRVPFTRTNLYDLDLPATKGPSGESFSNLRTRAAHAQDKVNEHKSMLDRYMPVSLSPVHHQSINRSNPVFLPSSSSSTGQGHVASVPFKPQVSETRQRVRNLLCKSKKDPHYFD